MTLYAIYDTALGAEDKYLIVECIESDVPPEYNEGTLRSITTEYNAIISNGDKWEPFTDIVCPGWFYHTARGVFISPEGRTVREPIPFVPKVIPSVTPLQLRTWLLVNKQLTDEAVTKLIITAGLSEQDTAVATIAWQYALMFERKHPFITIVGALLGMSSDEIDDAFIAASRY